MTLHAALLQAVRLLEDGGIAAPRLTAEVLLAHAVRRQRVYLHAHPEHELTEVEWLHLGRYLHERLQGKPTQYITGRQEFYGREFRVSPDVLIPRPETEHVVEAALQCLRPGMRFLDVGCGSGALAVTLQLETGAEAWACDISCSAAVVAAANAQRLGAPVRTVVCDLLEAMAEGSMDLIVSNPPYVPVAQREGLQREVRDWEPRVALFAGQTGFEFYDRIAAGASRVLRPGGWLVMELGFGSSEYVSGLLGGWSDRRIEPDLAGIPRVIAARAGRRSRGTNRRGVS
ncbi:MAG: peptide chain release factor N(5)-glutamine methyltransferase [Bryobacteraceae bacterium]|jgi:release factor glutamine methyltransferase